MIYFAYTKRARRAKRVLLVRSPIYFACTKRARRAKFEAVFGHPRDANPCAIETTDYDPAKNGANYFAVSVIFQMLAPQAK